jgi:uncharacterized protein
VDSERRRQALLSLLHQRGEPVTGSELASRFQVSRQAIVQDIAILRASGSQILATPQGYLIPRASQGNCCYAVVTCTHDRHRIEEELSIVVDLGGKALDVIVEHPIYGELRGSLMIASRRDLGLFLDKLRETEANPLSFLTGGIHMHTLEAPDAAVMAEITAALRRAGFLVADTS